MVLLGQNELIWRALLEIRVFVVELATATLKGQVMAPDAVNVTFEIRSCQT